MKRRVGLKTTRPMKRTPMTRSTRDFFVRARSRRLKADRETASRAIVRERSDGQCEVVLRDTRCWRLQDHTHHIQKRTQGGKYRGPNMLIAICAPHHDLADNASVDQITRLSDGQVLAGRLIITALGEGRFRSRMRASKDAKAREQALGVKP